MDKMKLAMVLGAFMKIYIATNLEFIIHRTISITFVLNLPLPKLLP